MIAFEGVQRHAHWSAARLFVGDDGQLLIDKSVKFRGELGQWGMPGSFFTFAATSNA